MDFGTLNIDVIMAITRMQLIKPELWQAIGCFGIRNKVSHSGSLSDLSNIYTGVPQGSWEYCHIHLHDFSAINTNPKFNCQTIFSGI